MSATTRLPERSQAPAFPPFQPTFSKRDWTVHRVLERQASTRPDAIFMSWPDLGLDFSFRQTNARTNRLAHGLRKLGIGFGDTVVLFMPNSPDYVFAWFALNKIGAIEAPINTAYMGGFLEHQVSLCNARSMIVDVELLDVVRASLPRMPGLERIVLWSRHGNVDSAEPIDGVAVVALTNLYAEDESDPDIAVGPCDTAAIMFTSGTTGLSKGVLMPHAQLYLFAEIDCQTVQLRSDDVYLSALPFFHANAQLLTIYPCLIVGARCALYEKFSASQWVERLRASGATVTNSLGVMLPFVHAQPPTAFDRDHRLTRIIAAPTPYGILDDFKRRFGVEQFAEGFGQTEICCPIMTPLAMKLDRPRGAAGLLIEQWFDVRIVDPETDEELPDGSIGELVLRHKSPWTINAGYVGMPEQTARAWRNLWYHTGDAVRRDADGWYYFVDRIKDSLRRRGENISSFEVEAPLRQHPAVADVAVVAVKSEFTGGEDEVKACVVLREGEQLDPMDLVRWCRGRLPAFAVPRYIEFMTQFPKTPSEKVQKNVLRAAGVTPGTWDRERHEPRLDSRGRP